MLPVALYTAPTGVLVVVVLTLSLIKLWRGSRVDPDVSAEADALTRYWTSLPDDVDHTLELPRQPLDDDTLAWTRPTATYRNEPSRRRLRSPRAEPAPRASVWPASPGAARPEWATALTAATLQLFNAGEDAGESTHAFDAGEVFDVMSRVDVDTQADAFFRADPLNALSLPIDLELPTISVDTFVDLVHAGQLTGSLNDTRSLDWTPWGYEQPDPDEDEDQDDDELDHELDEMIKQPALAGAH